MTELKTLKDITPIFVSEDNIGDVLISSAKLKEEAINELKYCNECMDGKYKNDLSSNFEMIYYARAYIKWKFNITEEDLK